MATSTWLLTPIPDPPLRKFRIPVEGLANSNAAISPDGAMIAYVKDDRLWIQDLDQVMPREIADTEGAGNLFWSPNSAFVGYFTGAGQNPVLKKVPVSVKDGIYPVWRGNEIFYVEGTTLMAVPVEVSPTFRPGNPQPLFEEEQVNTLLGLADATALPLSRPYDVTADGQRFVVVQDVVETDRTPTITRFDSGMRQTIRCRSVCLIRLYFSLLF